LASLPAPQRTVVKLRDAPGDLVTASASGLDPHIPLQNAGFQLDRIAAKRTANLKRYPDEIRKDIVQIIQKNESAP